VWPRNDLGIFEPPHCGRLATCLLNDLSLLAIRVAPASPRIPKNCRKVPTKDCSSRSELASISASLGSGDATGFAAGQSPSVLR
jgi:hypothetical protein